MLESKLSSTEIVLVIEQRLNSFQVEKFQQNYRIYIENQLNKIVGCNIPIEVRRLDNTIAICVRLGFVWECYLQFNNLNQKQIMKNQDWIILMIDESGINN